MRVFRDVSCSTGWRLFWEAMACPLYLPKNPLQFDTSTKVMIENQLVEIELRRGFEMIERFGTCLLNFGKPPTRCWLATHIRFGLGLFR
jgi:hypothetical protein